MTTRRRFLQQSALVSLSPWMPAILSRSLHAAEPQRDGTILVVVQLDGGNDGLNTVIPFADENYARLRPKLGIAQKDVLKLDDAIGLHPAMKPAAELFEQGRLAVVQGVGYPNPNRSHFRSMAIWQHTRLAKREHDSIGWLGRAADISRSTHPAAADSIYVGDNDVPVALRGRRANTIALSRETDLNLAVPVVPPKPDENAGDLTDFVTRTLDQSYDAARRFKESDAAKDGDAATYPDTALARKLHLASRLIKLGGGTRIYYVSQPGYDTHASQTFHHRNLLREFSGAVQAFLNDLRDAHLEDRVVVLAFSEFGRRAKENASEGTDHGAAAPVFLAGGGIRGGIIGDHPSLSELDRGDLKMAIDFRQVYATILDRWLGIPSKAVLNGTFDSLQLLTS